MSLNDGRYLQDKLKRERKVGTFRETPHETETRKDIEREKETESMIVDTEIKNNTQLEKKTDTEKHRSISN